MALTSSILPLTLLLILTPTALSSTCKSHKFQTPGKSFTTCTDLPYLSATLHYTFDAAKSTLSMAFTAPPSKPAGWVAWAINPTSDGMAGSQALLAYKSSNGSISVSTVDLQSYSSIVPGPISLKVSDLAGESSGNSLTLFATWQLPAKTKSVNQVWQVGPSVSNGAPAKHDFAQANLLSKSKLQLSAAKTEGVSLSPAESPSAESPAKGSQSAKVTGVAASAPAPASGKNAGGEGLRFGGCLTVAALMASSGFMF